MEEDFILLEEEDHGLGIGQPVSLKRVEQLEAAIDKAAIEALLLGVPLHRFTELCEAAHDMLYIEERLDRTPVTRRTTSTTIQ